ncbi:hypothetical protein [Solidesulfovibrio sp. C21]|uniref:hypothetical protein n=1 Tax=Solidesulfovibrio sp. C21 TaxID=3398613 RepID=UPI0039FCBDA1
MDYAAEAAAILPDFAENGQAITIRRPVVERYNPVSGENETPSAALAASVTAADTSIPLANLSGTWAVTNGVVTLGDETIFYAALDGTTLTGCTRGYRGTMPADAESGAAASLVAQDFPGYAMASGYRAALVDGTRIKSGDQQFTVAASGLGVSPGTTDKLLDAAGVEWSIVTSQAVAPGGVPLLYRVQGRQ